MAKINAKATDTLRAIFRQADAVPNEQEGTLHRLVFLITRDFATSHPNSLDWASAMETAAALVVATECLGQNAGSFDLSELLDTYGSVPSRLQARLAALHC